MSDLKSPRNAADTIYTESVFPSHTVLGKKEMEYVASEILSWKNLAGSLVRLSLTCKYLSMCMPTRLCQTMCNILRRICLCLNSKSS